MASLPKGLHVLFGSLSALFGSRPLVRGGMFYLLQSIELSSGIFEYGLPGCYGYTVHHLLVCIETNIAFGTSSSVMVLEMEFMHL